MSIAKGILKVKRFLYRIEKLSARHTMMPKLMILFLFLFILPVLFYNIYIVKFIRQELTGAAVETALANVKQVSNNLDNYLKYYKDMSNTKYLDRTLRSYLLYNYNLDTLEGMSRYIDAYSYINDMIVSITTVHPEISDVRLYVLPDTLPAQNANIRYIDSSLDNYRWFKELSASKTGSIICNVEKSSANGKFVFNIAAYLSLDNVKMPYGIILFEIEEESLFRELLSDRGSGDIYIYDESGAIITSTVRNAVGQSISEAYPDIAGLHTDKEGRSVTVNTLPGKALEADRYISSGISILWTVPEKIYLEEAMSKINKIVVFSVSATILSIIVIFIWVKLFSHNIRKVVSAIDRIENNDFKVKTEKNRKDEIGLILRALSNMGERINALIENGYKKEIQLKETEMYMLQAQINPHFLYNTLSSLQALVLKEDKPATMDMIKSLSRFYRLSLNKGKSIVTVREELQLIKNYLDIQNIRFKSMILYREHVEDELENCLIPKLTLQPLVENSIYHGMKNDNTPLNISIEIVSKDEHSFVITIADDGNGMSRSKVNGIMKEEDEYSGFGIYNIKMRLEHFFAGYSLELGSSSGTTVVITMPKHM